MRRLFPAAVLALGLALVSSGLPVDAANREHQQLMADLRMLQEQNQQLQLLLTGLTAQVRGVTTTLADKLDEQVAVNRKAFADSRLLVDNVGGDVRILREKVDDTHVRLSSLAQELEALRLAIPPAGSAPCTPADPLATPADPAASPAPAPTPSAPPLGTTPQRAYESAWADYAAGQWNLAIAGFESYIKTFPRSENADDAQFYIGQSFYNDGRFREAVGAFDKVIADYPAGNAVPDAYYKKGLALDRLGQPDAARAAFEFVIKAFPDSAAARLAKQNLDRLSRPPRP
jgi:tol-pal system protein YbgF